MQKGSKLMKKKKDGNGLTEWKKRRKRYGNLIKRGDESGVKKNN